MSNLKIWCFGNLVVEKDGRVIKQFDTDKSRALLVYLAIERARPVSRSHLAGLLWSDIPEQRALHSLRQTLTVLRRTLGDFLPQESLIVGDRDLLRLNPQVSVWVDALAFQEELLVAMEYFQRQDMLQHLNIRRLRKALDLKKGDFLEQFSISGAPLFDEWSCLIREDFNHRAVEGLGFLARYHEIRREFSLARLAAQKILQITPWDETTHLQVMRLYALDEQWSAFSSQYRRMRQFMVDQLGVEPSRAAMAFFDEIRQRRSAAPSLQMQPAPKKNFDGKSDLFVGREKELDDISDLMASPACKLLTIHGSGGVGKTCLAQEIAYQQWGLFQDGVFFFPLASISSFDQFLSAILDGLMIPAGEAGDNLTRLVSYLRKKRILLIFDNFEHLVGDADIAQANLQILAGAQDGKILVTSRVRLNLAGEWIYPLQGMRFPAEDVGVCPDKAYDFDSLHLFSIRARQVKPEFQLDASTLPAVTQICQILDGLPLGITLAAAGIWGQPCQLIADTMRANLRQLQFTASGGDPRNQSLWANLDISWQLMNERNRKNFARLGVFVDGFVVSAAEKIALTDVSALQRLVDQSLIRCDSYGRYRMHSVIRQYALERLARLSGLEATRLAFVEYYAGLLAEMFPNINSDQQVAALNEIQQELGNLKQAWEWLAEIELVEDVASFVDALHLFFSIRSRFQEGIDFLLPMATWLEGKMDGGGNQAIGTALAKVLARLGSLAHLCRSNNLARESLEKALRISVEHSQEEEIAFCRSVLADMHLRTKDFAQAVKLAQDNLAYYQEVGILSGQSQAAYMLGLIDLRRGRMESARNFMEEALEIARNTREPRRKIAPLNILGDIYCNDGDYDEAIQAFEESLLTAEQLDDLFQKAILLNNLASVYHVKSDYGKAVDLYEKSIAICRDIGDRDGEAIGLANLGEIASAQRDFHKAVVLAEQALDIAREIGEEWSIAICLNNLADAHLGLGECNSASNFVQEALVLALRTDAMRLVARCAVTAGRCCWLRGDRDIAVEYYRAALAHSATEFDIRGKAETWLAETGEFPPPEPDNQMLRKVVERLVDDLSQD